MHFSTVFSSLQKSKSLIASLLAHLIVIAGVFFMSHQSRVEGGINTEQVMINAVMIDLSTLQPAGSKTAPPASEEPVSPPPKPAPPVEETAKSEPIKPLEKPVLTENALVKKHKSKTKKQSHSTDYAKTKPLQSHENRRHIASQQTTETTANASAKAKQGAEGKSQSQKASSAAYSAHPKLLARAEIQYPKRALDRGLEGRVKVKYDVNAAGKVENIRIIDATPKNIFDREVKLSMKKWRYEAKIAKDLFAVIIFKFNGETEVQTSA